MNFWPPTLHYITLFILHYLFDVTMIASFVITSTVIGWEEECSTLCMGNSGSLYPRVSIFDFHPFSFTFDPSGWCFAEATAPWFCFLAQQCWQDTLSSCKNGKLLHPCNDSLWRHGCSSNNGYIVDAHIVLLQLNCWVLPFLLHSQ